MSQLDYKDRSVQSQSDSGLNIPLNRQLDKVKKTEEISESIQESRSRRSAEAERRRKNRLIGNIMIYSGIIILVILCIVVGVVLFRSQSGIGITSLKFSADNITLNQGYSQKLEVLTEPVGVAYAISFSSSDDSIISVSYDGTITCNKPGTVTIKAESSGLTAECTVVGKADVIETLSIDKENITLGGGQEKQLEVTFTPGGAKDRNIVWKSADESIALVDKDGNVKGVDIGETAITVTDTVTGLTDKVTVTVTGLELPEKMTFAESSVTLEVGETYNAELKFTPADITNKSAIYYTDDMSIASVTNEGVITAKGEGTVTIEAYYENDNTLVAVMEVTVIDPFVITAKPDDTTAPVPDNPSQSDVPSYGTQIIDGNTYIDGVLIANKTYPLSPYYNPGEDEEAMNALYELQAGASQEGYVIYLVSGFRSYDTQAAIYNNYVSMDGQAEADRYSARPGYSEHQTGLAFDVNELEEWFGDTPEGIWLAENCHKYGFIIRYPKGKEHITGYMYEPWHIRYLGKELAEKVYNSGLTLEEYLGITSEYQD